MVGRSELTILTLIAIASSCTIANAASYKCKNADGTWSDSACTGTAAPPPKPEAIDWGSWRPKIGMTAPEIRKIMQRSEAERAQFSFAEQLAGRGPAYNEWLGGPEDINRQQSASGCDREQWVFRVGYSKPKYLYFSCGILVTIQD